MRVAARRNAGKVPDKAERRRRALQAILPTLAAALVLALIFATPRWPEVPPGTRTLSSEVGYKAVVDQLAAAGLLRVRRVARWRGPPLTRVWLASDRIRQDPARLGDCRRSLELLPLPFLAVEERSRDCAERLDDYVQRASFLSEDMRRPAQWQLNDGRVTALKSNAHILIPAGIPVDRWGGRIRYLEESRGPARSRRSRLMFAELETRRPLFRFVDAGPEIRLAFGGLFGGRLRGEGQSLAIALSPQSRNGPSLSSDQIIVRRLGRAVLIGIPPDLHGAKLSIDGEPWEVEPEGFDNLRYALVRPGQFVTLEGEGGSRLSAQLVETPASISEMSSGRRLREPSLHALAEQLERSGVGGDVRSSISAELHFDLQARLAAAMEAGGPPGGDRVSHRGAALLLDGLTGEVAAAATYPTDRDQLAPADRDDPTRDRIEWLTRNWNFETLPVGSAAKVPFAAAIAQAHPSLLDLRIPFRSSFSAIDGWPITGLDGRRLTLRNLRGRGTVDFTRFIADSNNEYALTLMRRASLRDGGNLRSPRGWPANLWRFSCVVPFGLVPRGPDLGWRDELDKCTFYRWRKANGDALGTRPIPAVPLNLMMGRVQNDYIDFYSSILGDNRSHWTLADLAQAYARILSGRAANPNLASTGTPASRDSLPLSPRLWTVLGRGMAEVLQSGTARSLRPLLGRLNARGVYFYAKTGTSTLSAPAAGDGHILILAAARTRNGAPPRGPGDICALKVLAINLQRDRSHALDFAGRLLDPANGRQFARWLTQPCPADPAFRG
jgi:hypothetical protein